jgi:hypothetical protein
MYKPDSNSYTGITVLADITLELTWLSSTYVIALLPQRSSRRQRVLR